MLIELNPIQALLTRNALQVYMNRADNDNHSMTCEALKVVEAAIEEYHDGAVRRVEAQK